MTTDEPTPAAVADPPPPTTPPEPTPGGYRELITLSLPLILSASFWTVQMFVDRVFLASAGEEAEAAAMPATMYFWTPMSLVHSTVMYATVFVAQYAGAGRPRRIGPVVWQALYFSVAAGVLFPLLAPVGDAVIARTDHAPAQQKLESIYFSALTFAPLPMLVTATASAFYAGRGKSWTVLGITAVGTATNAVLAVPLIYWRKDDPAAAVAGAGYAAALGSCASAALGLWLLFRQAHEKEFATRSGWRFDRPLFARLMKFGLPNGVQWCVEGLSFTAFVVLVGNIGPAEAAATSITFALNMLAFLPVMGLGQGVEVLVGRRQGEERPDLSAKTAWTGVRVALCYMAAVAVLYCTLPGVLALPFEEMMREHGTSWERVAPLLPVLLRFVAAYSLADGVNIVLAYALRGAGDTRFVTLMAIGLSWPLMVAPTWYVYRNGLGLEAAWVAATAYIAAMAVVFVVRFRGGRWRTMKVIETTVAE